VLGKLFVPAVFAAGFFLYTHQPTRSHIVPAYIAQACDAPSSAGVSAAFAWPLPAADAQQTWLDLGLDPQFGLGWYQGHGPLPPSQQTFSVDGLTPGVKYYYRVNALTGEKFKTVAKGSFVPACATPPAATAPAESPASPVAAE
jgi:hypothetical protein